MTVLSHKMLAFERGRKAFRDGKPSPPRPPDDSDCTAPLEIEWLGWMIGRADEMMERREVMSTLGISDYDPNDIDDI